MKEEKTGKRKECLDDDAMMELSDLFKVFSDSTRVKILFALSDGECCVRDIAELLSMNLSAISHQLRILKQAKLVKNRKDGKTVFYTLADDHVESILRIGMEHILE